jgi:hypothetical protein
MSQINLDEHVVVAHLRGDNESVGANGYSAMLGFGVIAMIAAFFMETSAVRLAAWGAIWTGWNVLFGIGLLNSNRTHYLVYRSKNPPPV